MQMETDQAVMGLGQLEGLSSIAPTQVSDIIGQSHPTFSLKVLFHSIRASGPPRTGRAIPDNFGANQWGGTGVSGSGNHSLLMTAKESQFAIQFLHYRLPLCPAQLCAVS